MALSVDDVVGATVYRSMSRAGRMSESLSSKARQQFQTGVAKRVQGQANGPKEVSPLKFLSVAEVADMSAAEGKQVAKLKTTALDSTEDERIDVLCSSGRDHPEVKRKGEYVVTLEKEIAFHSSMSTFHGGVQTSASKQSATSVEQARREQQHREEQRREEALQSAAAVSPDAKRSRSQNRPLSVAARDGSNSPNSRVKTANDYEAARASPAFKAVVKRFEYEDSNKRAPPVGHYRPRYNAVDGGNKSPAFPKAKRVINASTPSPYMGDMMDGDEYERRVAAATPAASRRSKPLDLAPSVSIAPDKTDDAKAAGAGQNPGSSAFMNRGRGAPLMIRAPSPDILADKESRSRKKAVDRPTMYNDAARLPRGPSAYLNFGTVVGRSKTAEPSTAAPDVVYSTGVTAFDNKRALSFATQTSRDHEAKRQGKAAGEVEAVHERSDAQKDKARYRRQPVHDFGKGVSRDAPGSRAATAPLQVGDSHTVSGVTPEKPGRHTPSVRIDLLTSRPDIVMKTSDLSYDVDDSPLRSHTRCATFGASPKSPHSQRAQSPPASELPMRVAADSPIIHKKLAHDINFARTLSRDAASRAGRARGATQDEPDPIEAERLGKALDNLRPATKGNPMIATHVSRATREKRAGHASVARDVPTRAADVDDPRMNTLRGGYVGFGKMVTRDKHAGNRFANESRNVAGLFEKPSKGPRQAGKSPAPK